MGFDFQLLFFSFLCCDTFDVLKGLDAAAVRQDSLFARQQEVSGKSIPNIEQVAEMADPIHRFL